MTDEELKRRIAAYRNGDLEAGYLICQFLKPGISGKVRSKLPFDDIEIEDTIQICFDRILKRLRQDPPFRGKLKFYSITVAHNTSLNILIWRQRFPHIPYGEGPEAYEKMCDPNQLFQLETEETRTIIQASINRLGTLCRRLLRDLFYKHRSYEELRIKFGWKTVQAGYSRRDSCLEKLRQDLYRHYAGWIKDR